MSGETWRGVPGYEGIYEVSDHGNVRSLDRLNARGRRLTGKPLSPRTARSGHQFVALHKDRVKKPFGVHVLVLLAFVGPRPPKFDACHWNDDPFDNRLENLRWASRSENRLDCARNGNHTMANRTHCPQGHEYTPENTYFYPNRSRACNQCRADYRATHLVERRMKGREYMRLRRARDKQEKVA